MKAMKKRNLIFSLVLLTILICFYVLTEWDSCEIELTINGRDLNGRDIEIDNAYFFATEVGQKNSLIMNWYHVAIVVPSPFYHETKSYKGLSLLTKRQRKENAQILTYIVKWIKHQQEYGVVIELNDEVYKRIFSTQELDLVCNGTFPSRLKLEIDSHSLIKLDKDNWQKDYVFAREPPALRIVSPPQKTPKKTNKD